MDVAARLCQLNEELLCRALEQPRFNAAPSVWFLDKAHDLPWLQQAQTLLQDNCGRMKGSVTSVQNINLHPSEPGSALLSVSLQAEVCLQPRPDAQVMVIVANPWCFNFQSRCGDSGFGLSTGTLTPTPPPEWQIQQDERPPYLGTGIAWYPVTSAPRAGEVTIPLPSVLEVDRLQLANPLPDGTAHTCVTVGQWTWNSPLAPRLGMILCFATPLSVNLGPIVLPLATALCNSRLNR